jgi:hypothetical protein
MGQSTAVKASTGQSTDEEAAARPAAGPVATSVRHVPSPPWWVLLALAPLLTWVSVWALLDRYDVNRAALAPVGDVGAQDFVDALSRWDSDWYEYIADNGYFYDETRQSAVAFFPTYPLAIRVVTVAVADTTVAGILVTLAAMVGSAIVLYQWAIDRVGVVAARFSLLALAVYPYAFFLYGHVYSDALFLLVAAGAFLAYERGHPFVAGLLGVAATAGRPVGIAVAVGLVVLVLERRGVLGDAVRPWTWPSTAWWRRLAATDGWVLLAPLGLLGYLAYQWWRFDEPLAFVQTQQNEGWSHEADLDTLLKTTVWRVLPDIGPEYTYATLILQTALSIAAVLLLVPVWRRFGPAYGLYTSVVVLIAVVPSPNFIGMGRYLVAAFPLFVLAGAWAERWRWLAVAGVIVSYPMLVYMAELHSRGYLVS